MSTVEIIFLILLILLVGLVITLIILLNKKAHKKDEKPEEYARLEGQISQLPDIVASKVDVSMKTNELSRQEIEKQNTLKLQQLLEEKLTKLLKESNTALKTSSEDTNKIVKGLVEEITKVKASAESIATTGNSVNDLIKIIQGNNQQRGQFGEFLLNTLLQNVFGPVPSPFYEIQYNLPNGRRADAVIHLPLKEKLLLAIDSKFPFSNFNAIYDENNNINEQAQKEFVKQVKKHITDVHDRYIIKDVTVDYAVVYLPSDEIFYFLSANHYDDVFGFAQKNKVVLSSPNTLLPTLQTLHALMIDYKRVEKFDDVIKALQKLSEEFKRLNDRWDELGRNIDSLTTKKNNLDITFNKITKQFDNISNVKDEENVDVE